MRDLQCFTARGLLDLQRVGVGERTGVCYESYVVLGDAHGFVLACTEHSIMVSKGRCSYMYLYCDCVPHLSKGTLGSVMLVFQWMVSSIRLHSVPRPESVRTLAILLSLKASGASLQCFHLLDISSVMRVRCWTQRC